MPDGSQRLVVVLGMHRSGTSVLARALQVLGIELGDRLMPASADNPRGYWEDLEVVAINERVLAALSKDWRSPKALDAEQWHSAALEPIASEAEQLLKSRLEQYPQWGCKDPRMCMLLPFWQPIFRRLELAESYIVALRDPRAVADSLEARGRMVPELSYLLWLEHLHAALTDTVGKPRVLVEYDEVLRHPREQLYRLAVALALEQPGPEDAALREYENDFLAADLRHHQYSAEISPADSHLARVALKAFRELRVLALQKSGDGDFRPVTEALQAELTAAAPILPLVHQLDHRIQTGERELVAAQEQMHQSRQQFAQQENQLRQEAAELRGEAQTLTASREALRREITDLRSENHALTASGESVRTENDKLRDLLATREIELQIAQDQARQYRLESAQLARGLDDLRALNQGLIARGESLQAEKAALEVRAQQSINAQQALVAETHRLWSSSSWRLGRPVRNLLRRMRGYGKEAEPVPAFEVDALHTILTIRQSLSWELTAPLRLIHRVLPLRRPAPAPSDPIALTVESHPLPPPITTVAGPTSRELENGTVVASAPLISVIIPSYNHASFVAQAIDSVAAQDHPNLELIVIDDGSSDNSLEVIEASLKRASSLRSELYPQQNRGAHAAINRGLELAHGEYLTILNSDDYYYPSRLAGLLKFMREANQEFAFSEVDHVGPDGSRLADSNSVRFGYVNALAALPRFPSVGFLLLLYNLTVTSGNFLMRRDLFEKIGFFHAYRVVHDWDYVLRVLIETEPGFIRESLMAYRVHDNNTLGRSEELGSIEGPRIIANYFETVSRLKAPNPLAPTAYNWPQYFDRFSRNYPLTRVTGW